MKKIILLILFSISFLSVSYAKNEISLQPKVHTLLFTHQKLEMVRVTGECLPSSSYTESYKCSNGTVKQSQCTIYKDTQGNKCRETCTPKTCAPGD